jgi:hypothetical protein
MTTNLHDKMLAAIDAYFSASNEIEAHIAEEQLLDVRAEIRKQKDVPETNFGNMAEPKIGCVNHDCDQCKAVQKPVAVIGSDFQLLYCREDWAKGLKVGDTLCLCTPTAAQPAPVQEPLPQCTHNWVSNPKEKWCLRCGAQEVDHIAGAGKVMPTAAQPAPVQEPVAKVDANDEGYWADILPDRTVKVGQLLYTAPQPVPVKTYHDGKPWPVAPMPWVGLTDEMVVRAARELCKIHAGECQVDEQDTWNLYAHQFKRDARCALEAALEAAHDGKSRPVQPAPNMTHASDEWALTNQILRGDA